MSDVKYSPKIPFSSVDYKSELDTSLMYDQNQTNYFQNLIGVLHWIIELGRIDIAYEVFSLSKVLAKPRTGHIYQALHILKYLESHIRNNLSFDPLYHNHAHSVNTNKTISDMKEVYVDAVKDLPPNAPEPRGKSLQINCKITRRL